MQGYGYGNFMRVYMDHPQSGSVGTIGEIGWDGWTGTYFIANPYNNEAIIFMTQRCEYVNPSLIRKMRNIVQVMFE
jgi:CubicO group peptidase (beta-lactamase class C family)